VADLSTAPHAFRELYEWLLDRGFKVLQDRPGGRLNQYSVLGQGLVQITVRADRGDWDVTASVDAGWTFWQVDLLEAYLDSHAIIHELSSEEHQAEFVRTRLDELRGRLEQDPDACAELYRLGDDWVSWRLGIPIPDGGFPGRKPC
jgi:hypothetical protein